MGGAARRILLAASPFMPGEPFTSTEGWEYESGKSFEIGPFCITPFLVDHSAYDSYSFLIEAGGKRLFYSGDFRAHGRKASLVEKLIETPPIDIDTLLLKPFGLNINQELSYNLLVLSLYLCHFQVNHICLRQKQH